MRHNCMSITLRDSIRTTNVGRHLDPSCQLDGSGHRLPGKAHKRGEWILICGDRDTIPFCGFLKMGIGIGTKVRRID